LPSDDSVGFVRRRPRFAAWLYTGPVGHLYGGTADALELLVRYWWARARGREI
jgi:hypothetical protein